MTHFTSFVRRLALASALVLGAAPAFAGPMYHVEINTAGVDAASGLLDFGFAGTTNADLSTIKLSNFSGTFGAAPAQTIGDVVVLGAGYTMSTAIDGMAFLTRAVNLGGEFGFDIAFADNYTGTDAITFAVALYGDNFAALAGVPFPLVTMQLFPAAGQDPAYVGVSDSNGFATSTVIPEPSELLLMLTGLALAAFLTRRARNNAA